MNGSGRERVHRHHETVIAAKCECQPAGFVTQITSRTCWAAPDVTGQVARAKPVRRVKLPFFRCQRLSGMNRRDSSHNWGTAKTPSTMGKRRAAMRIVNNSVHGLVVVDE